MDNKINKMERNKKKVVMMFGLVGSGKSTVANEIIGKYGFVTGDSARSVT